MADYIHGSSDEREVARLEKQAGFVAPLELKYFDAAPGARVLDLATGVGAMAAELARRFPGIELTGLELRPSQLEHARRRHPVAQYVQGDASRMPFPDGHFDRVHCSWLLEHVRKPLPILREVLRVLKPGGYCQFIEVDNETFRTRPPFQEVIETFAAMNDAQVAAGGDPFVGRRLGELFGEAGFAHVKLIPCAIVGNAQDMTFFEGFVDEFAEIFEGLDEAFGPERMAEAHAAAARLRSLLGMAGGEIAYQSMIAQGWR